MKVGLAFSRINYVVSYSHVCPQAGARDEEGATAHPWIFVFKRILGPTKQF